MTFRSPVGAVGTSLALHGFVYVILVWALSAHLKAMPKLDSYIDLGYQTFETPPEIVPQVQRVRRASEPVPVHQPQAAAVPAAHELQDAQGVVAGAETATKPVAVGADTNGTASATPYYKIKPKYPNAALAAGTEGWVLLQVDISETGEVENIRVVDGEQRNLFQGEAKRAVAQWKYRPFVDGAGRPFRKTDHQVRVDFKLEEASGGT